jgi:hypothetical protein
MDTLSGVENGGLRVRRRAGGSASARFSARHPMEVFPTELTSDEEMERNPGDWRRMNVFYKCDGMNVFTRKYKNKQKSCIMQKKVVCLYSHNNLPPWEA